MSLAVRELLRPPPHRGPLIAAGAVCLAVGVALEEAAAGGPALEPAAHGDPAARVGGLIFWLGAQAPNEGGVPPAYQSILLVTGPPCSTAGC